MSLTDNSWNSDSNWGNLAEVSNILSFSLPPIEDRSCPR
jgi:hypothetical protein